MAATWVVSSQYSALSGDRWALLASGRDAGRCIKFQNCASLADLARAEVEDDEGEKDLVCLGWCMLVVAT
jgi:hypothetical protein